VAGHTVKRHANFGVNHDHVAAASYMVSGTDPNVSALERAFQMARSGQYATVAKIRMALTKEGYSASQVEGPELIRQLQSITKTAREVQDAQRP
jgi:hypothetical protein